MAPNNNISYGVGAKTYGASPYRRNAGNERGRTGRASAINYPESVLTRAITSQNPARSSRIGMQLLRELTQNLPTTPSRISPNTNGSRRLRPRTSRVEQHGPSQMVLNRGMPFQSRTALGVAPMPAGIPIREVPVKDSSRKVRIRNNDKEAQDRIAKYDRPSISMSNISTARRSLTRKASTLAQQYDRIPLAPVIMVDALEEPEQEELEQEETEQEEPEQEEREQEETAQEEADNEDTEQENREQADGLYDENESVQFAPQEDQADQADEVEPVAVVDEDKGTFTGSGSQEEKVEPPTGTAEKDEKPAASQQCMKIFPCFRGEYPTRNRPAPYQWFEQTGFKGSGPGPGAGTATGTCIGTGRKLAESEEMTGDENVVTTCEVTEEHFLSIGCDCDEKALWSSGQEAPHFMGGLSVSEQGQAQFKNIAPQQQGRPFSREHQPRCMPQGQSSAVQQQQATMFRSHPNQNPSSCGLTEMLAQQLHQQMQEAQAQIAQVQLQLKNACGPSQTQQTNMMDQCCNDEPYWMCEDLGEDVGCDEPDYTTEQSLNISCSEMCQEQQQEVPKETRSCILLPSRSCAPPSQAPPSYSTSGQCAPGRCFQQQPQQQEQIPCQQRPPCQQQQQQQQQQKCSSEQLPCRQQQQSPPCQQQQQQQQQQSPPPCQMQQQQLLMHILQQQQKLLLQQQEQQQKPKQRRNQQQQSMMGAKSFQQQNQSQHNMCPHLSHCCASCCSSCCPSCYCQRYAKMRFMMPRRWPC